jgi:[ribosomal protein S5]-alanine N-acetyltransferase
VAAQQSAARDRVTRRVSSGVGPAEITVKAPEHLQTERLILRRPISEDAELIYARYSSDLEVTRYLSWPRHESAEQTRLFLRFSDLEWERWPAGPYLIESRESGSLLGGTGLTFETPHEAATGYVLARDAWGKGYATEALAGLMSLSTQLALRRVYALCHLHHAASHRVLEKCGFLREHECLECSSFPNLGTSTPQQTVCYARTF